MIQIDPTMSAKELKQLLGSDKPVIEKPKSPERALPVPESLLEEAAAAGMDIHEYLEYVKGLN